jgi:hypothetical protein
LRHTNGFGIAEENDNITTGVAEILDGLLRGEAVMQGNLESIGPRLLADGGCGVELVSNNMHRPSLYERRPEFVL